MKFHSVLLLLPLTALLAAASGVASHPGAAQPAASIPLGVDLGSSSRIPRVAGLAGEGEGFGRTAPSSTPAAGDSMGGMRTSQGSKPGMGQGSMGTMPMNQRSMPAMDHGQMGKMPMNQGMGQPSAPSGGARQ